MSFGETFFAPLFNTGHWILQASLNSQDSRGRIVNPVVMATSSQESLSIVIAITNKCLSESWSRPSFEDILWNLQYAAQIQATADNELRIWCCTQEFVVYLWSYLFVYFPDGILLRIFTTHKCASIWDLIISFLMMGNSILKNNSVVADLQYLKIYTVNTW